MPSPKYGFRTRNKANGFCFRLILLACLGLRAYPQASPGWGFWNTEDGMKESYSSSVSPGLGGRVWIKHGAVSGMNVLDGYTIAEAPDLGATGKLQRGPDGTLWTWAGQHLYRFNGTGWDSFDVEAVTSAGILRSASDQHWEFTSKQPPFLKAPLWVAGRDRDHALILLPDRILEFDAVKRTATAVLQSSQTNLGNFLSMRRGVGANIWITGRKGIGNLSAPNLRWEEPAKLPTGYSDFNEPFEGEDGEVFLTAAAPPAKGVVLLLQGANWKEIYQAEQRNLRGWRGIDRTAWVQDGNRLLHLAATGKLIAEERAGSLSGILLSAAPEGPGTFWVGTSQGIAVHRPALWRTPSEAAAFDEVVNAMAEDRDGRIWFLGTRTLVCFDSQRWNFIPLPKGETAASFTPYGLAVLPDGSLAIRTNSSDLLTYDPKRRRFRNIKHPAGRDIRLFFPQADGSLLVQTLTLNAPTNFALERYDGRKFQMVLNPGASWQISDLRSVLMGDAGELWVGASNKLGVYRDGAFHAAGAAEGFTDNGAFYVGRPQPGRMMVGGRDGVFSYDGRKWRMMRNRLDRARSITSGPDGSLWVASGTGVYRFKDDTWISYGVEEGLPSIVAYRVFVDSVGRIWAGTTRGLAMFHPDADPDPPMTRITGDQNAPEVAPGGRVTLVFSGVDKWKFTPSERLLFSWRMDNGPWSQFTAATSASFNHVSAGPHRFQVRAMDRNGNIDPAPAAHSFSVLVPWFETPGFRAVTVLAAIVIVILLSIAISTYRQRGRLIQTLSRKKNLERDRQEILEMVARREPLPDILQRIATALCTGFPEACGCAVQIAGSAPILFSQALPDELKGVIARADLSGEDWQCLNRDLSALGFEAGPAAAIQSGGHERLGAVLTVFPKGKTRPQIDSSVPETMSKVASAAIESARLYDELAYQAGHDLLTGLPNRATIESELQHSVERAKETGQPFAVMFLDFDRFKHINDSLGHRAGDFVLGQVSRGILQMLPPGAMLSRVGGDEFIVLTPRQTNKPAAGQLAARILDMLHTPVRFEGHELFVTASIGISMYPYDSSHPEELQKQADLAMYRAKALGKNRFEFYCREIAATATSAIAMEGVLRKALDEGWFELLYQPQLTASGELIGLEALLRLRHPTLGRIAPGSFIGIAEQSGLIDRIGEWALREVCAQIARWQFAGYPSVKVAVNVSAHQFAQASFSGTVSRALNETQVAPRLLELELTESMIMSDINESAEHMRRLRSLGVSIAVDDFGTGYSSLAYLHRLPIDILKIDRSFVQEMDSPSSAFPLVQAIVCLAHNLGLEVVAEGVTTEDQYAALREMGCDYVQGFLFYRPQTAEEIEELFRKRRAEDRETERFFELQDLVVANAAAPKSAALRGTRD